MHNKKAIQLIAKIKTTVYQTLDANKATNITVLDVKEQTDVTDYMIICTGTSMRHLQALKDKVVTQIKKMKIMPRGVSNEDNSDWVLIDFGDIIVHIMLAEARKLYDLESLWNRGATKKFAQKILEKSRPSAAAVKKALKIAAPAKARQVLKIKPAAAVKLAATVKKAVKKSPKIKKNIISKTTKEQKGEGMKKAGAKKAPTALKKIAKLKKAMAERSTKK